MKRTLFVLTILVAVMFFANSVFAGGPDSPCTLGTAIVIETPIDVFSGPYRATLTRERETLAGVVLRTNMAIEENQLYVNVDQVGEDRWARCEDLTNAMVPGAAPQGANPPVQQPPAVVQPQQGAPLDPGLAQNGVCDFAQRDVTFNFPAPSLPPQTFYQPGTGSGQERNILVWLPQGGQPTASFGAYYTFVGPVTASCLASQIPETSATQIQMIDGTVIMMKDPQGGDAIVAADGTTVIFDPTP